MKRNWKMDVHTFFLFTPGTHRRTDTRHGRSTNILTHARNHPRTNFACFVLFGRCSPSTPPVRSLLSLTLVAAAPWESPDSTLETVQRLTLEALRRLARTPVTPLRRPLETPPARGRHTVATASLVLTAPFNVRSIHVTIPK